MRAIAVTALLLAPLAARADQRSWQELQLFLKGAFAR